MDMQMPVMDGVTATHCIRAQRRFDAVPVIAMTANAMEQDRRKCLDAGMNDFLVKPIEPEDMWNILLRWVRARRAAPASPAPAGPTTGGDGIPRGIPGLDATLGLKRMMNKKPLYLAMLKRYATGQREALHELRNALAAGDLQTAERIAHTAKAVSGNVGATVVQEKATQLELALRERAAGAHALAREFEALALPLMDALDAQLAAPAGPAA
jgi:CheY-like chemotaxis protein